MNILSLLFQPDEGEVFVDNIKLKNKKDFRKYQNLISFVSQDTFLLDDTIKNNILFGSDEKFNQSKFDNAINFSRVDKYLADLPEKENTLIGVNSKQISSGQKQRLAIARLIYNCRDILIFDEATNALDQENENIIIKNIFSLKGKKTVLIVSHNKHLLKDCDKIYELKGNKITENY